MTTEEPQAIEQDSRQVTTAGMVKGPKRAGADIHMEAAVTQTGPPAPVRQVVKATGPASTWQVVDMTMANARMVNFFDTIFF